MNGKTAWPCGTLNVCSPLQWQQPPPCSWPLQISISLQSTNGSSALPAQVTNWSISLIFESNTEHSDELNASYYATDCESFRKILYIVQSRGDEFQLVTSRNQLYNVFGFIKWSTSMHSEKKKLNTLAFISVWRWDPWWPWHKINVLGQKPMLELHSWSMARPTTFWLGFPW